MEKNDALKLWIEQFGDCIYAYDFSGKKIKKDEYLTKTPVSWTVGFIKPIELGGSNHIGNLIIMHNITAEEKGLSYPEFNVGHDKYVIQFDSKNDYYYIEKVLDEEDD